MLKCDFEGLLHTPGEGGLVVVIDPGLPTTVFRDYLDSFSGLTDYVKFGWGSALVTPQIRHKVEICRASGVTCFLGGTFFEWAYLHECVAEARHFIRDELGLDTVEISNGTIPLHDDEKRQFISSWAEDFTVMSEVGLKDPELSIEMAPSAWIHNMDRDLQAGAAFVVAEARESGRSGICRENGELRVGLVVDIADSQVPSDRIVWEAPSTRIQADLIKRLGPDTHFGNVAFEDLISLESLKKGLRADTLLLKRGDAP